MDNGPILRCACRSYYQDAQYGPDRRAHNLTREADSTVARCTVCGSEKTYSSKREGGEHEATGV